MTHIMTGMETGFAGDDVRNLPRDRMDPRTAAARGDDLGVIGDRPGGGSEARREFDASARSSL